MTDISCTILYLVTTVYNFQARLHKHRTSYCSERACKARRLARTQTVG